MAPEMVVVDKVAPDGSAVKGAAGDGHVEAGEPSIRSFTHITHVFALDARGCKLRGVNDACFRTGF